jgi:molybdopterin adenylyltransferase
MTSYVLPTLPLSRLAAGSHHAFPCASCDPAPRGIVPGVTLEAKVLTVSESVSRGTRQDRSGQELAAFLANHGYRVVERRVVPDGMGPVAAALTELSSSFAGLLVTTGGTGFSPTDLTPEATRSVIEREAPGLAEAMRAVSPLGRLSRGVAGAVGACLVLNVPGSPKGAIESFEAVVDVLPHALELLAGGAPH